MKNNYINDLISKMSLEQKIGAVLTLGFAGMVPGKHIYDYIEKYHCGGLRLSCEHRVFGSYIDPKSAKKVVDVEGDMGFKYKKDVPVCTASEYKSVLEGLQQAAKRRPLSIPLHFSYDQEGGTSADFSFGGVNIFPKPMGLRATNDPKLAYQAAKAVAQQSKAVGFNWLHSPVLDINTDPRNPEIYTRAYSDNVKDVVIYSRESCKGFKEEKMIVTGKHFPGRGHSDIDAHFQVPVIDVDYDTLMTRELLPYKELIAEGLLPSIMLAHSIFPALDKEYIATVSKKIITGLLRETLGFEGVITTDSMTMGAIATRYGVANACALSLEAGADLVLMKAENSLVEETVKTIKEFVKKDRIKENELDKKVYRILNLKYEYGLFHEDPYTGTAPEIILTNPAIQGLANTIARKSTLIVKNDNSTLPLQKEERILVVEQKIKNYNTMQWHSGILYENCMVYGDNVSYLETDYTYDDIDKSNIMSKLDTADTIVFTNYYMRGSLCNTKFLEEVIEKTKKKIVIVTNTPYKELSIPENSNTVVVSFATSPENVRVTAGILFGKVCAEGVWPLSNTSL